MVKTNLRSFIYYYKYQKVHIRVLMSCFLSNVKNLLLGLKYRYIPVLMDNKET